MKLNIVDKGNSNVMNGADIPDGTVFLSTSHNNRAGLYVKYCKDEVVNGIGNIPSITVISSPNLITGHVYTDLSCWNFPDYKVVEELTAVVKWEEF